MYDYMNFDEFIEFMEKFLAFERGKLQESFDKYDENANGEISARELRNVMRSFGFTPLKMMLDEAMEVVDLDNSRELSFSELVAFFAVYQHSEGFTRAEVAELKRYFEQYASDKFDEPLLMAESLSDALVQFFGLEVSESTQQMGERLKNGQGMCQSTIGGERDAASDADIINFEEFLILARTVREEMFTRYRTMRPRSRSNVKPGKRQNVEVEDASHGTSESELREILTDKGITAVQSMLDEILQEVCFSPWGPDSELDADEFFDFMYHCERRDGFRIDEVQSFRNTHAKFDEDGSGEVSAMECNLLLRDIGYRVTLDDIRDQVAMVDVNSSGQLDVREFIRLMRIFRERELAKIQAAYDQKKSSSSGLLRRKHLQKVLEGLGHDAIEQDDLVEDKSDMTFDDLVVLCDSYREDLKKKEKKKAAFSDEELENFEHMFQEFDKNHNNEIDVKELQSVLEVFGWQPRTREEQERLMKKIELARTYAREAGVDDLLPEGCATVHFWTFVQLLRILQNEADKQEEKALQNLQVELQFSEAEVEDFRQVFRTWTRMARESAGLAPPKSGAPVVETLQKQSLRRLVRSLGVTISVANEALLDKKIQEIDEEGRTETAQLDFKGFLHLMRWILDCNFAGINEAASASVTA